MKLFWCVYLLLFLHKYALEKSQKFFDFLAFSFNSWEVESNRHWFLTSPLKQLNQKKKKKWFKRNTVAAHGELAFTLINGKKIIKFRVYIFFSYSASGCCWLLLEADWKMWKCVIKISLKFTKWKKVNFYFYYYYY